MPTTAKPPSRNRWNQNQNQNRGNGYNISTPTTPRFRNNNAQNLSKTPVNQHPAYQAPAHQASGVSKTDFESYVNANDAVLSYDESKSRRVTERAFMTLFGQDNETFTSTIEMTEKFFAEYTGIQVKQFRETLLLHMGNVKNSVAERTHHKRQYDRMMNERQMQSRENIRLVNGQVLSDEVHLTAQHNVFANEQLHSEQSDQRNSSKESYGSNDMAYKYYLEVANKKTQDKNTNLKPSVMHTTSLQNTTNGSKPKSRSNNQTSRSLPVPKSSRGMLNGVPLVDHFRNCSSFSDSKHFVCSTCQKCVFNANHDDCITKFLKEVNSRAKVQSPESRNNIKPAKRIPNVNKPKRWIFKGYRFSSNKFSAVHEKPNTPRSCLR
ncbi:hypothetical protein Tco_1466465 [Tanacetum coccineum]